MSIRTNKEAARLRRIGYSITPVNVLHDKQQTRYNNVDATPTMIYRENGRETMRFVGGMHAEELATFCHGEEVPGTW